MLPRLSGLDLRRVEAEKHQRLPASNVTGTIKNRCLTPILPPTGVVLDPFAVSRLPAPGAGGGYHRPAECCEEDPPAHEP